MATLTKPELAALSLPERMALIDDLWDSVDESLEGLVPPEWHRQMLDEILDEDEQNPRPTVAWEKLRAELAEKWIR